MMISISRLILLVAISTSTAVIAREASKNKLVITGSSTIAPLALELGKRYEKQHPGVRVDIQTGGSTRGITDARQGFSDIGMVSRSLYPEEKDLVSYTIASDGIAMIVHKTNPITSLSREQIISIYSGKIRVWQELGGKAGAITVVNKAEGRSTLELFLHYLKLKNTDIKAQIIIGDNEQGIKTIMGNPQAIGYVSIGTAEYHESQGTPIKLIPLNGLIASVDNVKKGAYPLSRSLNFVTKGQAENLAKDFIAFARSEANADLIKEQYFVPIQVKE